MNRTPSHVAAAAVVIALILSGCGAAAEKASEKATEQILEEQIGGNVDIDTGGDGSVEIETDEGSASFGTGDVPEEWPEFLELPDDVEIQSGTTIDSSDGRLVTIVGITDETPEEVLARYKDLLAEWEISGESTSSGGGSTLTGAQWENGKERVSLAASDTEADGRTFLTLGHTTLG
ncbi:MAG: hypothetical protein H6519_11065 [Microthrixaceae bacterium]|nr:hypothetical protein [Acidimicrobiales bacterium]MCB9404961.1 hypothetical protein [Microthrixaceae bacterium]